MVAYSDTGKSVIEAATRGVGSTFSRVNGQGTWKDRNGNVTGYALQEDSKITKPSTAAATGKLVAAYAAQRKKAGTKGYT